MEKSISINLIDNMLGYLQQAAEHIEKGDDHDWKFSVLHTCSALELIFKAQLQDVHWSLIFDNIDKADYEKLKTGDFKSASFDSIIERRTKIIGIEKPPEVINILYKIRNKIQHYEFNCDKERIRIMIAQTIDYALKTIKDQKTLGEEECDILFKNILDKCYNFTEFYTEKYSIFQDRLDEYTLKGGIVLTCPFCVQDTLIIEDEERICLFCKKNFSIEKLSQQYNEANEIKYCPECGKESCIYCVNSEDSMLWEWLCLVCGEIFEDNICSRCGELNTSKLWVCQDCYDEWMNSPHT